MIANTAANDLRLPFSVVIPTYNRPSLLLRAVESVHRQVGSDVEIIVVDDASPRSARDAVRSAFPAVRYLRRSSNGGPGPARDDGIRAARAPWVLMLDDDDELVDGAPALLRHALAEWPRARDYPFLQFTCSNGGLNDPFRIVRLEDYLRRRLWGDFTHVVYRREYVRQGLRFPATRLGAESLLVWDLSERFGIPTWNIPLTKVHDDAPERLTHFAHQVRRAGEYAQVQERILERFGEQMRKVSPNYYTKKLLGAAAYRLLAGHRAEACRHLKIAMRYAPIPATAIAAAAFLPRPWLNRLFLTYRSLARQIASRSLRTGKARSGSSRCHGLPRTHVERTRAGDLPTAHTNHRAIRRVTASFTEP